MKVSITVSIDKEVQEELLIKEALRVTNYSRNEVEVVKVYTTLGEVELTLKQEGEENEYR